MAHIVCATSLGRNINKLCEINQYGSLVVQGHTVTDFGSSYTMGNQVQARR